jgi:signal transduction histidine kinase/CheY-like chemotaxis protein
MFYSTPSRPRKILAMPIDDDVLLEALYRALFETIPDGLAIVDDVGRCIDLNGEMCRIVGAPREQFIGQHFDELAPRALLDDAGLSGAVDVELPLRTASGALVNCAWRVRSDFYPGLHAYIARDLTGRDVAQRALTESEERYRAFVANSSEAIWRFELEQPVPLELTPDEQIDAFYRFGYLAECNESMARMYGFEKAEDIVGARLGDLVVRDDPANVEYLRAFIDAGYRLLDAESAEVDREGNRKYFLNNLIGVIEGNLLIRAWGTQRDITDRKHGELTGADLLDREAFLSRATATMTSSLDYERTLESVADIAVPRFADWCLVDILDEETIRRVVVRHSDPAMVRLAEEAERRFPTRVDLPYGAALTIRTGETQMFDLDEEFLTTMFPIEELRQMVRTMGFRHAVIVPLVAQGRTLGALTFANAQSGRTFSDGDLKVAHDLGHRAGMAIENARLYRELERVNRAKDEFLAMLSHELRTPMTATLGWASILQMGSLPDDMVRTAIDAIAESTRAQAKLIDDLLDVSRIITGKMQLSLQPVVLADAVQSAVDTIRPAAEAKQIALYVALRDRDLRLTGDPWRLQQVFWNLLSNAVKFTPRVGRIDVALERDLDSVRVDHSVRVVVRDSGEGIAPNVMPYIFERFRQGESGTKRKFGGLGLGLSIARNLVELHGGTLTASSEGAGSGSEFVVTLPLDSPAKAGEDLSREKPVQAPLRGLHLLVVEDEPATSTMLEVALRQFGAEVVVAGDAPAAMHAIETQPFDVIVSDIGLPGEDGFSLMRRIRALRDDIPAIALTAYGSSDERERALEAGFRAFLLKPIDPARLAEEIVKLGAHPDR